MSNKKFIYMKVKHVEDFSIEVVARGLINDNNEFEGEYKYKGFTYGVVIPNQTKEKRLDELKIGDTIIDNKGSKRTVGFINPCLNGTWYSISLNDYRQEPSQMLGYSYQVVKVPYYS